MSIPPRTWNELIDKAEAIGNPGALQVQGQRFEGLTVFFISLLASAGGTVLDESASAVSLAKVPAREALGVMKRIATSPAADPALATSREDQAPLAFETGGPMFMVNYSFVWPSAHQNAPEVAAHMSFARCGAAPPGAGLQRHLPGHQPHFAPDARYRACTGRDETAPGS